MEKVAVYEEVFSALISSPPGRWFGLVSSLTVNFRGDKGFTRLGVWGREVARGKKEMTRNKRRGLLLHRIYDPSLTRTKVVYITTIWLKKFAEIVLVVASIPRAPVT